MEQADLPNEGTVFFSDPRGLDTWTKKAAGISLFFQTVIVMGFCEV